MKKEQEKEKKLTKKQNELNKNQKKNSPKKEVTLDSKKNKLPKNSKQKKSSNNSKSKPKKTLIAAEKVNKKDKQIKDGKFRVDILDILIIVVLTSIVSCVLTGLILNYQYKQNNLKKELNTDENINEFLNTYTEIVNNYYEEVDEKGMVEAAISGMLNYLEDNYSIYLDKDETDALSEILDSSYEGIGIVTIGNVIYQVYDNSPAIEAGLKANDEIIKVNGQEINSDNFDIIDELISKNETDTNEIIVKRKNEKLTFNVGKSKVTIPVTATNTFKMNNQIIGYISLSSFSEKSFEEFQEKLMALENDDKINSLIIDLRSNTGGYLNSAFNIASIFIEKGKTIYSLENKNNTTTYKDETKDNRNYKIVVLVNNQTASAAEVLTAALKDSYGATIVGTLTYGKGKVQTTMSYGDTMMKYTSAKWLRPNGECIDEIGIKPDYEVEIEYKDNTIYDKQLDKAIDLLK